MVSSIDSDLFLSSVAKREVKTGSDILGKDDFLKILMVQLKNQDPLNPMADTDFIAQMATFSSLEQMTNMNKSIDKLVQMQSQTNLIAYHQFIGKEVTWHSIDEQAELGEHEVKEGKGIVQTIQFIDDTVKIILDDGTELAPANISEVHQLPAETPLIQASGMIGKAVTWMDGENEKAGVVESVSMKDGMVWLIVDGQSIRTNQLIKIG